MKPPRYPGQKYQVPLLGPMRLHWRRPGLPMGCLHLPRGTAAARRFVKITPWGVMPPAWPPRMLACMAASANDETAEPTIARVARAVTQPGGKNIDWKRVRAAGAVIAGMSIILGVRHRRWRYTHTVGVVLGIAAAAAARLKDKYVETPDSK